MDNGGLECEVASIISFRVATIRPSIVKSKYWLDHYLQALRLRISDPNEQNVRLDVFEGLLERLRLILQKSMANVRKSSAKVTGFRSSFV